MTVATRRETSRGGGHWGGSVSNIQDEAEIRVAGSEVPVAAFAARGGVQVPGTGVENRGLRRSEPILFGSPLSRGGARL